MQGAVVGAVQGAVVGAVMCTVVVGAVLCMVGKFVGAVVRLFRYMSIHMYTDHVDRIKSFEARVVYLCASEQFMFVYNYFC